MSLGGKTTTSSSNKIDPDLKAAALENLAFAKKVGQLGYVPYTGATVAGMQPGQISAIQSGNLGAEAFGLPSMAVPTAGNLSPYADYQAALAAMPAGQRNFINSLFINPQTGAGPSAPAYGNTSYGSSRTRTAADKKAASAAALQAFMDRINGGGGNGSTSASNPYNSMATPGSYAPGGMNTYNPNSFINQVAASLRGAGSTQSAPTVANRPVARP